MIQSHHSRMVKLAVTLISSYCIIDEERKRDLSSFQNISEQSVPLFKILEIFQALTLDQPLWLTKSSLSDMPRHETGCIKKITITKKEVLLQYALVSETPYL